MGRRFAFAPLAAAVIAAGLGGCATIGHDFDVGNVPEIEMGTTTRSDIVRMFGTPWRTGIEDGREAWTYGHYRFSMFGPEKTRDLVVRFDDQGRVVSYSFSSTEPEDLPGGASVTE